MAKSITPESFKRVIANLDNESIQELLDNGIEDIIEVLEENDFFGTEGFDKRYA